MSVLRMTEAELQRLQNKHRKPREPAPRPTVKEAADGWPIVLRDQIVSQGLPEPLREACFHPTRGWRSDLSWPDLKLAVECDGAVHRVKGRYQGDIAKHNGYMLMGWRYLRVTPAMVRNGEALGLVKEFLQSVQS